MPYNPPNKDTVHFVGGVGTKADRNQNNGGGCTKTAWDGSGSLSEFMGTNGGPKTSAVNATYTNSTKTVTATGIGNGVTVGTLAYVSGTNITSGVYEVTVVTDNDNVVLNDIDATGDNTDTTINVGGALDTLQNAVDNNSTKAGNYNRTVYTNLDETLTAAVDFDAGSGSSVSNTWKRVIGFNTAPGDMDEGGTYCQGPLDAYQNGINPGSSVSYDANNQAIDVFVVSIDNIEFRNLYLHNTDALAGNQAVSFSGTPENTVFRNCKFADVFRALVGSGIVGVTVLDCYFHNDLAQQAFYFSASSDGGMVLGCVFYKTTAKAHIYWDGVGMTFQKNLFVGGVRGINLLGRALFSNNTFYNQTTECIRVAALDATLVEFNNIFGLEAADDYAVYIVNNSGSVIYSDYSWAYCPAGGFTVDPWYDATNNKDIKGANSTKDVDPQFVDAANGDFRSLEPAVLCGGRSDVAGSPGQIGAIIQKYKFAQRARAVNLSRLAIFR